MMDKKSLFSASLTIVCVVGFARCGEYPAGVDPRSCPDYPNCDNAALHAARNSDDSWNFEREWNAADAWNSNSGSPVVNDRWNAEPVHSSFEAARYPAGVNPRSCPSYPNCDNAALHRTRDDFAPHDAPDGFLWASQNHQRRIPLAAPNWNAAINSHASSGPPRYPAGVNAKNCPDYPYC